MSFSSRSSSSPVSSAPSVLATDLNKLTVLSQNLAAGGPKEGVPKTVDVRSGTFLTRDNRTDIETGETLLPIGEFERLFTIFQQRKRDIQTRRGAPGRAQTVLSPFSGDTVL